jgi:hypothetical protein
MVGVAIMIEMEGAITFITSNHVSPLQLLQGLPLFQGRSITIRSLKYQKEDIELRVLTATHE